MGNSLRRISQSITAALLHFPMLAILLQTNVSGCPFDWAVYFCLWGVTSFNFVLDCRRVLAHLLLTAGITFIVGSLKALLLLAVYNSF